mmetsp:Transcript_5696/g.13790  ORF Transcript_5696/g.13790 Transcript_5696/m.13790 type:complete len:275 (+) Transcript_5696:84-908(+)
MFPGQNCAADGTSTLGDVDLNAYIVYCYTLTNTGSETLTIVSAVDDNGTPGSPADDITLDFGGPFGAGASSSIEVQSTVEAFGNLVATVTVDGTFTSSPGVGVQAIVTFNGVCLGDQRCEELTVAANICLFPVGIFICQVRSCGQAKGASPSGPLCCDLIDIAVFITSDDVEAVPTIKDRMFVEEGNEDVEVAPQNTAVVEARPGPTQESIEAQLAALPASQRQFWEDALDRLPENDPEVVLQGVERQSGVNVTCTLESSMGLVLHTPIQGPYT